MPPLRFVVLARHRTGFVPEDFVMRALKITLAAAMLAGTGVGSVGIGFVGVAAAQTNPTAAQLINSLMPTGSVAATTRGIKPLDDSSAPASGQIISSLQPSGAVAATTRGIKPLAPAAAAAAAPAAMQMAAVSAAPAAAPLSSSDVAAPNANLAVNFQSGSANLTPQAMATLNELGRALTSPQLAAYNFKIAGHTDTVGDPATNQSLSSARAQAVKTYLETKFGVSDSRLQAVGLGESDLLVPTPPQTPNERNRRVQIINLGS
jgi:outer membrane protein OmpA-like peptidoglycan-associated protein